MYSSFWSIFLLTDPGKDDRVSVLTTFSPDCSGATLFKVIVEVCVHAPRAYWWHVLSTKPIERLLILNHKWDIVHLISWLVYQKPREQLTTLKCTDVISVFVTSNAAPKWKDCLSWHVYRSNSCCGERFDSQNDLLGQQTVRRSNLSWLQIEITLYSFLPLDHN